MKLFLLLTVFVFITSVIVTFYAFLDYKVFLNCPLVYKLLIGIGLVTPLVNIYDSIKAFVLIVAAISNIEE